MADESDTGAPEDTAEGSPEHAADGSPDGAAAGRADEAADTAAPPDSAPAEALSPADPPHPPAPRRGPHPALIPVMAIATALVLVVTGSALFANAGASDVLAKPGTSASAGSGTSAAPSATAAPTRTEITTDELRALAGTQTDALKRGDVDGFLAPYDPAATDLIAERRRLFANLKLVPFTQAQYRWERLYTGSLSGKDTGRLSADVVVAFVHQVTGVDAKPVTEQYIWTVERPAMGAPLRITGVRGTPGRSGSYPLAWDLTALVKAERPHVVMLAGSTDANKIAGWADRAENAAKRDLDLWKGPSGVPARFLVFASPDPELFAKAYGGTMPKGTVAFCAPMAADSSDTRGRVIVGSRITWDTRSKGIKGPEEQTGVLRHEMGHALVAGFMASDPGQPDVPLWIVEGFAEYLEWVDRFGQYYVPAARDFVASDGFTGKLPGDSELYGEDAEANGIGYHLSMTAIRYLVDKYGAEKAFAFVVAAYRNPRDPDKALQETTGLDLATFESRWAKWVKSHV